MPALLSLIGGKTYSLLRDLCAPAKPATKTFVQLTEILGKLLSPKPFVIAEWFRVHKRGSRKGSRKAKQSRTMLHKLESCQNIVNLEATCEILFEVD